MTTLWIMVLLFGREARPVVMPGSWPTEAACMGAGVDAGGLPLLRRPVVRRVCVEVRK